MAEPAGACHQTVSINRNNGTHAIKIYNVYGLHTYIHTLLYIIYIYIIIYILACLHTYMYPDLLSFIMIAVIIS